MHVPAEEWQQKMEASVKEVQKLENHYITKYQSKVISFLFLLSLLLTCESVFQN